MPVARKIEIGVIIALISLCLVVAAKLSAHGGHERDQDNAIASINKELGRHAILVEKVPIIEYEVRSISQTLKEVKVDVKELLEMKTDVKILISRKR